MENIIKYKIILNEDSKVNVYLKDTLHINEISIKGALEIPAEITKYEIEDLETEPTLEETLYEAFNYDLKETLYNIMNEYVGELLEEDGITSRHYITQAPFELGLLIDKIEIIKENSNE